MITLSDRIFLATLATLFLAVLIIERNARNRTPKHVLPAPAGVWPLRLTNVPQHRTGTNIVEDVGFVLDIDSAIAGHETDE